ncbi:MAG: YqaJ viral recombinase family protein [Cellulosilyticaceae bacterium]
MKAIKLVSTKNMSYEDWLKWRKKGLGGSEAATVAGLNPWSSPINVYLDKTNEEVDPIQDNERMRVGRDLEDYVAKRFEEATGFKVRRENYLLQHPEHDFMLANLDRVICGENAFLECKTTGSYSKSEWEEGIPLHYELQCLHYMAVGGFDYCYIACLIGNEKFVWHRIGRDEETINNLIIVEKAFWEQYVIGNEVPEPDGSNEYSEVIKKKYSTSVDESIELNSAFEKKLARRDEIEALTKELDKEKKQIDQEIQVEMEISESATVGNRKVTWKTHERTTVDTKRLKAEKPELYTAYSQTINSRVFKVK